ncbi:hypothetical protein EW146_g311 [Bondarzewia mesenterica]|uniref:T6SS Phospholipase effector Tle1-like catalytic domain-containing protein n=1 Tax=Bondarzewia mesenterica TaxID=1095465 RepID=A0A4S4M7Z7_9AGAM|nr:hypothetical protein EW146_g311 [Bondarzewia mesenterica]
MSASRFDLSRFRIQIPQTPINVESPHLRTSFSPDSSLPVPEDACPTCGRKKGTKNLIVCLDGTANQIGVKNTFVVQLYDLLEKDSGETFNPDEDPQRGKCCPRRQMAYYSSGLGTYATTRTFKLPLGLMKRWIRSFADVAFAWHFEEIVMKAYQWLSTYYESGDRIYLFGFSRGAYQVRTLAGMIGKVGLLYPGNIEQIPFAYEQYVKGSSTFRTPVLREAPVHFVGAWYSERDTVSSIGPFSRISLPFASFSDNVKFYRHALALDEHRVRFVAEYLDERTGMEELQAEKKLRSVQSDQTSGESDDALPSHSSIHQMRRPTDGSKPKIKEVWFVGSHSDVGGGNMINPALRIPSFSVDWMIHEARIAGLRFQPSKLWVSRDPFPARFLHHGVKPSLRGFWKCLERIPMKWLDYDHLGRARMKFSFHTGKPRRVLNSQKIHISVKLWYRFNPRVSPALAQTPGLMASLTQKNSFSIILKDGQWEFEVA